MGVPVITLRAQDEDNHAHNVGCSLLANIELLKPLITDTPDEYVTAAVRLAGDMKRLDKIRKRLRSEMLKSPLCDGGTFVRNLEDVYDDLWAKYSKKKLGKSSGGTAGPETILTPRAQQQHEQPCGEAMVVEEGKKDNGRSSNTGVA